ncbi:MAG: hypothetical protein SAK29_13570 [Scytonema sp. PMC 1069.18]|nr:hypothetical protein [Scytonema sp. PMC 1069.18]MEC4879776.1 hypothetical protein [Scytonema sp. PMC 1070.18]
MVDYYHRYDSASIAKFAVSPFGVAPSPFGVPPSAYGTLVGRARLADGLGLPPPLIYSLSYS